MAGLVEELAAKHGVDNALQMTLGISDGDALYAVRYSTEGRSRTLYHTADREATMEIAPDAGRFSRDARAIVSEPLSHLESEWIPVPEASFIELKHGHVKCVPFAPISP